MLVVPRLYLDPGGYEGRRQESEQKIQDVIARGEKFDILTLVRLNECQFLFSRSFVIHEDLCGWNRLCRLGGGNLLR